MNVNNVAKKILPIAASAAIGLGALTACSSSKDEKQETTYLQTEMLKLDNTLDSLKSARGDGALEFSDYYIKSKEAINNANPYTDKENNNKGKELLLGLGLAIASSWGLNQVLRNLVFDKIKIPKASALCALSIISFFAGFGLIVNSARKYFDNYEFGQYKEQKIERLNLEKEIYDDLSNQKEL